LLRTRSFIAIAAVGAALVATAPAGAVVPKLVGTVGPGFTISLKRFGKPLVTLKAGTYSITVSDKSNIHNFHLTGPKVNKKTSVTAVGKFSWKITFKKGTYKYVCDPHASIMKGSFTVK
jgi:plastocyanin